MMTHRKHDYDPTTWRCTACGTYAGHLIASSLPCVPVEDARPVEAVDVDYGAITRGVVG